MPKPRMTLVTIDYPPDTGGVARYLSNLVAASNGDMDVIDARSFFRETWPRWFPLIGLCRRQRTVLLVSHVFPIGTAAWIARLFGGPRYMVLFHGLDVRLVQGYWKRWLLRRICRSAQSLFCVSDATRRSLYALVPGVMASILTPGIEDRAVESREHARQKLNVDPDAKIVLSVARLVPRKGIDQALRAMGRIQHTQAVEYVVLGDGTDTEKERLITIAQEARVRVRWIRSAMEEEKWLWFAAADVFLLPVRDEGNDVEGFGIVYLEAAMAGIPAVAGKSGGAPEAVRHERTGLVVKPESVDAIEDAVKRLLSDDELRLQLGRAARARVESDFRWIDRWHVFSGLAGDVASAFCGVPSDIKKCEPRQDPRSGISVVIPCYNHAKDLRRTLEALATQTHPPQEVIVVDDFSTDDPEQIVNMFSQRLPIQYMRLRHNHGAPYARNEGARLMSAPYLLFLDADAALVPNALELFAQALDLHPECNFAYSSFLWGHKLFRGRRFELEALKQRNYIHTSSVLRRSAFPGFDETLKKFHDWDLWLSMALAGSKGLFINRVLFRVTPRKEGYSRWLPKIAYAIPWAKLGFEPREIGKYREAELIVKTKHHL